MSDAQSSAFLTMPTELRHQVYEYLIVECLADGSVSDIAGLFHCCREVNQELEAEYMPKIRPLLRAKDEWEATSFQNGLLRIALRPSLRAKVEDSELCVSLPVEPDIHTGSGYRSLKSSIRSLARSLCPALRSPWHTLKLSYCSKFLSDMPELMSFTYETLLRHLSQPKYCILRVIDHIQRLVLGYKHIHGASLLLSFNVLWDMFRHSRALFLRPSQQRFVNHGWISRTQGVWSVTLDFEQGLDSVEGALWELGTNDGSLVAKRLFGSSKCHGLPELLEDHFRVDSTADNFLQILDTDEADSDSDSQIASYNEDDLEEDDMAEQAYESDELQEELEQDYEGLATRTGAEWTARKITSERTATSRVQMKPLLSLSSTIVCERGPSNTGQSVRYSRETRRDWLRRQYGRCMGPLYLHVYNTASGIASEVGLF
jgi:hypothetical protein